MTTAIFHLPVPSLDVFLDKVLRRAREFDSGINRSICAAISRKQDLAVLHLDVVGSTKLVQKDFEAAHERLTGFFGRLAQLSKKHDGCLAEKRGDAAIVIFRKVDDAIELATSIRSYANTLRHSRFGNIELEVRMGISSGKIIWKDDVLTGEAVVRAQRLEQMADTYGICIDKDTLDRSSHQGLFHEIGSVELKGFRGKTCAYALDTI